MNATVPLITKILDPVSTQNENLFSFFNFKQNQARKNNPLLMCKHCQEVILLHYVITMIYLTFYVLLQMKEVITRTNSKVNRAEKELHHTGTCDLRTRY